MKIATAIAFIFSLGLTVSAQAGGDAPTTKEACEKAHMTWDEAHKKCVK